MKRKAEKFVPDLLSALFMYQTLTFRNLASYIQDGRKITL